MWVLICITYRITQCNQFFKIWKSLALHKLPSDSLVWTFSDNFHKRRAFHRCGSFHERRYLRMQPWLTYFTFADLHIILHQPFGSRNNFPQNLHWCFFSPSWMSRCVLRWNFLWKLLPQSEHLWARTLVWVWLWRFIAAGPFINFPQISHWIICVCVLEVKVGFSSSDDNWFVVEEADWDVFLGDLTRFALTRFSEKNETKFF